MKAYLLHFNSGVRNKDSVMIIIAENEGMARIIARNHSPLPITSVNEFNIADGVVYSSF